MKITHVFVCRTALLGLSLMLQCTGSSGKLDPYPRSTKWIASTPWRGARCTAFFGGVRHNDPLRVPSYRAPDPVLRTRGGDSSGEESTDKNDHDEDDDTALTNEHDEEDELQDEEEDGEVEEESDDEDDTILIASIKSKDRRRNKSESDALAYDEPYFLSPGVQIYTSFAPLLISRKIDMFHPRIVRGLRFLFIAVLVLQQAFIVYVRFMVKSRNDNSVVHIESPFDSALVSKLVENQTRGNAMLKNLASSFLSKYTTVMEYDMGQVTSMQSGIIFSAVLMWILHFRFELVQPLLMTVCNNLVQLVYNPLFQVYVLGRNLERPFKTPKPEWMKDLEAEAAAETVEEIIGEDLVTKEEEHDSDDVEVTVEEIEEDEEESVINQEGE